MLTSNPSATFSPSWSTLRVELFQAGRHLLAPPSRRFAGVTLIVVALTAPWIYRLSTCCLETSKPLGTPVRPGQL